MEQSINSFNGGLQIDAHPMILGNDILTDCLNGTLITMSGNEVILQNDMGNRRVDNAFLPKGYVPVGMKEYGGVIYVASYNPITDMSLLGSFPSPQKKAGNVDDIPETVINFNNFLKEEDGNYSVRTDTLLNVLTPNNSLRVGDKFYIYSSYLDLNSLTEIINNHIINLQLGVLNSQNEFVDITNNLKTKKFWKYIGTTTDFLSAINKYSKDNKHPDIEKEDGSTISTTISGYRINKMISVGKLVSKGFNKNYWNVGNFTLFREATIEISYNYTVKKITPPEIEWHLPSTEYIEINRRSTETIKMLIPDSYLEETTLPFYGLEGETIDSLTMADEEFLLKRLSLDMDTYSSKLVSPLYIKSKLNYPSNVRYGINISGNDLIINATYTTESNYNFPIDVIVKDLDGNILADSSFTSSGKNVGENEYLATYTLPIDNLSTKKQILVELSPKLNHGGLFTQLNIYLKHLHYETTIDIADAAIFKLLSWRYKKGKFAIKYSSSVDVNIILEVKNTDIVITDSIPNQNEGIKEIDTSNIFNSLTENTFYNIDLKYQLNGESIVDVETLKYYNSNLFDENYTKGLSGTEDFKRDYNSLTDSTIKIEDYRTIGKIIVTPGIGYYFNESLTNSSLLTLKDRQTKSYETFDGILEGYSIPSESFYLKSEGTFNFISKFSIKNTNNYPKSFLNSIKIKNITYSTPNKIDLNPNPGTLDVEIENYDLNQLTLKVTKTDKITGSTEREDQSNYVELKEFSSLFDKNNIENYIVEGLYACLGYWQGSIDWWQFKLGNSAKMAYDKGSSDTLNKLNVNQIFKNKTDKNASMYRTNVYLFTESNNVYYNVDNIGYILDQVFSGTNSNKLFIRAAENEDHIMIADESDILIPQWWKINMDAERKPFKTLLAYVSYAAIWMKYGEGKYYPIIIYPCAINNLGKYSGSDFFNKTVDGINYAEKIKEDILTFLSTKINRVGFFDLSARITGRCTYYLSGTVTPQTLSNLKITFPVILSLEGEDENFKVTTSMETSVTLGIYQITSPKNLLDYLYIPSSEASENLKGLWNEKEYNVSTLYYKYNNSLYGLRNVTYNSIRNNLQLPNDLALLYKTFHRTKDSSKKLDEYTFINYNDPLNVPKPNDSYYYPHPGVIILEDLDGGYSNDTVSLFNDHRTGRRFIFNAVPSFTL